MKHKNTMSSMRKDFAAWAKKQTALLRSIKPPASSTELELANLCAKTGCQSATVRRIVEILHGKTLPVASEDKGSSLKSGAMVVTNNADMKFLASGEVVLILDDTNYTGNGGGAPWKVVSSNYVPEYCIFDGTCSIATDRQINDFFKKVPDKFLMQYFGIISTANPA